MVTRTGLVVKNKQFSPKNGDEIGFRRQIEQFSPQIGDENRSRRQKQAVLTQNW
ncbi:hypothetical protein [Caldifermentibacillus hisashii]|uniref:hypothetical protein n=1 Tax=Caldifermentibacillus hisashii TaxID=996558 RepID=UPI0033692CDF